MEPEEIDKESLKDLMRTMSIIRANIENWKYVETNKNLLPRERLEQTIEQMLGLFDPIMLGMQTVLEVEALTRLDPDDLI